ncbi:MAG: signal recognition particle-docking protein FtsY [Anaerolineae bacterium]|nr:signal recognition particle-docking protein FtsY [Anaerolineae bacterium]
MFDSAKRIRGGLTKTRRSFFGQILSLLGAADVNDEMWEDLEALLIQADVGMTATMEIVGSLQTEVARCGIHRASEVQALLKERLIETLQTASQPYLSGERMLNVVLVVGANGSGKTTSIAKLAHYHQSRGDKVILAAADTFRAAAIDQLRIWGERTGTPVIAHQPGADPGAVVYDAIRASRARGANVLIADTAGRLHTKYNLMQELKKVVGVARKQVHQAPHETLLVLDATTGQNALSQARHFKETVDVTGAILAKLDGTAKGGMAFAIAKELTIPIRFVGTGETLEDFSEFSAEEFVAGLFQQDGT